jgi:uncharacterized membrane protein YadS
MITTAKLVATPQRESRFSIGGNEDWWSVWMGLGVVVFGLIDLSTGAHIFKFLAVSPVSIKWTGLSQIGAHYVTFWPNYLAQFVFFVAVFGIPLHLMGRPFREFFPGFVVLYICMLVVSTLAGWKDAGFYNLEAALIALVGGLLVANLVRLPEWFKSALRVEFFVKFGIVLLGATFPIALIFAAGTIAIVQSTIISVATAATIYFAATRLFGLDKRFAAVLGTGGSVCGVSASIAVAASVGARKEEVTASVTLVVVAALIMVFALPFLAARLALPAGVGGAWIGSSEFADAAGYAAASLYGQMVGDEAASIRAFTMNKVIGRDLWIGVWSLFWAFIALRYWEEGGSASKRVGAGELWRRFPKFVIGFFVASALVSLLFGTFITPVQRSDFLGPIGSLRGTAFTLSFLAIGLSSRFADLESVNWRAISAFTMGAVVNIILGYLLSAHVFANHWAAF